MPFKLNWIAINGWFMTLGDMHSAVRILRTTAWQVAAVYATIPCLWLLIHPFTKFWCKNRAPIKSMALIWLLMWAATRWIIWRYRNLLLYSTSIAIPPGLLLIGIGFSIYCHIGDFGFARLAGQSEMKTNSPQLLITHGMHGRVRHPIYLAHFCCLLGLAICSGLVTVYGLVVFSLVTGVFLIRLEDKELERRFGEEFLVYQSNTPALLPLVRRPNLDREKAYGE